MTDTKRVYSGAVSKLVSGARRDILPITAFFDIETVTVDPDTGLQDVFFACYETWETDTDTGLATDTYPTDSGILHSLSDIWDWIGGLGDATVVAHNMRFDAAVLRVGSLGHSARGYTIDLSESILPLDGGNFVPYRIALRYPDGSRRMLTCNTNYYKMPLATIGKSFGVDKGDWNTMLPSGIGDAITGQQIEYCRTDVEILRKSWFAFWKFTQEWNMPPGLTIAATAKKIYRKAFFRRDVPDKLPNGKADRLGTRGLPYRAVQGSDKPDLQDVHAAEVAAYIGGRTDAFWRGSLPASIRCYGYDINSTYPAAMLDAMPIRFSGVASSFDRHNTSVSIPGKIKLARVRLNIPPDAKYSTLGLAAVETSERGKTVFPVGEFDKSVLLWEPELHLADRLGYITDVETMWLYEGEPIFADYVSEFYGRRLAAKSDGDTAQDLLVKLLLNALYGKFAQGVYGEWAELPNGKEKVGVIDWDFRYGNLPYECEFGGRVSWYRQTVAAPDGYRRIYRWDDVDGYLPDTVIAIPGYITSKARVALHDGMRAIIDNGGDVLYTDTDSIIATCKMPDDMIDATKLGKWKLEHECDGDKVVIWTVKDYIFADKIALKGIRNPVPGQRVYEQSVFPNNLTDQTSMSADRRERADLGAHIPTIVKRVRGDNHKRRVIAWNAATLPLRYDELELPLDLSQPDIAERDVDIIETSVLQ